MFSDLKKLVDELEVVLAQRGSSLDAPAREAFSTRIENLRKAIDQMDPKVSRWPVTVEALELMVAILSMVTNVTLLLK